MNKTITFGGRAYNHLHLAAIVEHDEKEPFLSAKQRESTVLFSKLGSLSLVGTMLGEPTGTVRERVYAAFRRGLARGVIDLGPPQTEKRAGRPRKPEGLL